MKNVKSHRIVNFFPVLTIILFLCLIGIGNSQLVSPEGIKRYGTTPLSTDKTFQLKKFEAPLPEKKTSGYVCEVDLQNKIIKVKKKTGEEYYQIKIPSIETLSPKLKRSERDAFLTANATLNGDIILCYYDMDEFYYSKRDDTFFLLPSYTKEEDQEYQFSYWKQIDEDYFISRYSNRNTDGAGYAMFHAETKKLYKLKIPADMIIEGEFIDLTVYDPSSRIVHAERCKDTAPHETELEVIADAGYYKIEEVIAKP
jgi:hypothetical protein